MICVTAHSVCRYFMTSEGNLIKIIFFILSPIRVLYFRKKMAYIPIYIRILFNILRYYYYTSIVFNSIRDRKIVGRFVLAESIDDTHFIKIGSV